MAKLRLETSELRGFLKEENATESKESAESSGESDSRGDLHQTVKVLRSEARNHQKIICLLKKQLQWNSVSDARSQLDLKMMASNMEQLQTNHEDLQRHTSTLEKENKPRERKEMEDRYERRRQGQSSKSSKNQKQHTARHAVSISHICCWKR